MNIIVSVLFLLLCYLSIIDKRFIQDLSLIQQVGCYRNENFISCNRAVNNKRVYERIEVLRKIREGIINICRKCVIFQESFTRIVDYANIGFFQRVVYFLFGLKFCFLRIRIIFGKISAQPHTLIMYAAISDYHYKQTAIMKGTSQSENCMHN